MLETTQAITTLLAFAVLVQFCVDRVKDVLGEKMLSIVKAPVWALAFGILFAVLFHLDLFAMLGLPATLPVVAYVVTGLILSASSSSIHELIEKLRQSRISDQRFLTIGTASVTEKESTADVPSPSPILDQKGRQQHENHLD